jgi:hypothetical protein
MNGEPLGLILSCRQLNRGTHVTSSERCPSKLVELFTLISFVALDRLKSLVFIAARKRNCP